MTSDDARRYLIAYDIPDDKRRSRLAKKLLTYGDRIQYSVFVADCRPARLIRLRSAIAEIITTDTDSVLLCDLGPVRAVNPSTFSYVGVTRTITPNDAVIV